MGYTGLTMDTSNTKPIPSDIKTAPISSWGWDAADKEVVGINVCSLIGHLFPDYWDMSKWSTRSYEADRKAILEWCAEHGAHYYARGREDFSLSEAREEALTQGLVRVVYEDLS